VSRRTEKVNGLLQSQIAELLQRQVKHPALTGAMISITRVEVTADLSIARVHVSVMTDGEDGEDQQAEVLEALIRTEPYLHRQLVKRLRMRRVPRLRFIADHSIAEGDRLAAMMRELALGEERER
jgi:ribosome-binding factor A